MLCIVSYCVNKILILFGNIYWETNVIILAFMYFVFILPSLDQSFIKK